MRQLTPRGWTQAASDAGQERSDTSTLAPLQKRIDGATRAADSSARLYGQPLLDITLQTENHLEKNQGNQKQGQREVAANRAKIAKELPINVEAHSTGRQILTKVSLRI